MITYHWKRDKGNMVYEDAPVQQELSRALDVLINVELKYGADITTLEPNEVRVETRVMGDMDYSGWTGDCEGMGVLYRVASFYLWAKTISTTTPELNKALIDRVMEFSKGIPLYLVHGAGMVVGPKWSRIALLSMLAHEKDLLLSVKVPLADLFTAFVMVYAEGYSVDDVKALLGEEMIDESRKVAAPA